VQKQDFAKRVKIDHVFRSIRQGGSMLAADNHEFSLDLAADTQSKIGRRYVIDWNNRGSADDRPEKRYDPLR
jgi:hypothetical protein